MSYSPGDEVIRGLRSKCCDGTYDDYGICGCCKDHADAMCANCGEDIEAFPAYGDRKECPCLSNRNFDPNASREDRDMRAMEKAMGEK